MKNKLLTRHGLG